MAPVALLCGHATLDVTDAGPVPGGAVYYAAGALAAMGATVRVVTRVGPDFPRAAFPLGLGPGIESGLGRGRGPGPGPGEGHISTLFLPSPSTTRFENRYAPGGARTQRVLAAAEPLAAGDIPAAWRDADLVLLAPVLGEVAPAPFAATVRARAVGLCVQGLVREVQPNGAVSPRRWEPRATELAGVAVALVGEDEARGQPDLVARLAAVLPLVIATRGVRGCEVLERGRPARRVGIHPAREADPTGAGDVFAAALLLALAGGADAVEAARLGAAAASIAVEGRGGEALLRAGEAFERARRVPVDGG